MNLPNRLTVSRLALTLVFLMALFSRVRYSESVALILFSVASITDYYDGMIARRDKLITDFGILMDPLADKILVCSAFIVFVDLQLVPAWMVVIVVARELSITGLRLLAASKNVVLAAERYGKHKTISQIVAILAVLLCMSYPQWGKWSDYVFTPWLPYVKTAALYVAVFLTITSGSLYLWRNRALYSKDL